MWMAIVRFGPAATIALTTIAAFTQAVIAQPEIHPPQNAAALNPDEGWSFDDIKDVCEAIQFVMFSLAVGCTLYWFWFKHLPTKDVPRIEFDVDVERVGENDAVWIIDVVALVKNLGRTRADLAELRFVLESVVADRLAAESGSLAKINALKPLIEGEWAPAKFALDAGTQTRRAFAAAIPKTVNHVVVTGRARNAKRTEIYDASKLVRLNR
jgi:hypothetical protein